MNRPNRLFVFFLSTYPDMHYLIISSAEERSPFNVYCTIHIWNTYGQLLS